MSLKIYGIGASRAVRPLWVAAELGLNFEHIPVPYQGGATRTSEFLALNPNGHIPVIEDHRPEGTVTVWESMACALYLAKVHGTPDGQSIAPANAQEEADALRWSFWTVTEVEKDALTVLMHRLVMPVDQRKPECLIACFKHTLMRKRQKMLRIWQGSDLP
jgi:glutathione S-transferase